MVDSTARERGRDGGTEGERGRLVDRGQEYIERAREREREREREIARERERESERER